MFEQRTRRWGVANELHSTAIVEPKVMMPIGDGLRLATGIYFVSRHYRLTIPQVILLLRVTPIPGTSVAARV